MRFELYTDSERKENTVPVLQVPDYSAQADKLSKANDNQIKLYVIGMLQRWEAVSKHLMDLEKHKPGLYPDDVNTDIMTAYNLGLETYDYIRTILRKKSSDRDYEELARSFEDFKRRYKAYEKEVKRAEDLLLVPSPVVLLQNSPDSSEEPRVSAQAANSSTTAIPAQPLKEVKQVNVEAPPKVNRSFLTKLRDEQSGSADPDYMAKQDKKKAKRHAR